MARVIDNEIYRGRSEGVFCIESERGLIFRNKNFENNYGVVFLMRKKLKRVKMKL